MDQHSAKKWKIEFVSDRKSDYKITTVHGKHIVWVSNTGRWTLAETLANATLIANAPTLLKQNKDLVQALEKIIAFPGPSVEILATAEMREIARQVLDDLEIKP